MPVSVNSKAFGFGSPTYGLAGQGVAVKEGVNCKQGTATLVAGTVTVANTSVTATSRIFLTPCALNASPVCGELLVTVNPGVSFTVTSYTAAAAVATTDVRKFNWEIFEQG